MIQLETLAELLLTIRPSHRQPEFPPDVLVWTGSAPDNFPSTLTLIAEKVGYQREELELCRRLSRPDAGVWLHLLATCTLTHGSRYRPRPELSEAIESAFDALGQDAIFLTNCGWAFVDEVAEQERGGPYPRFVHTEPVHAGGPWTDSARYSLDWEPGPQQLRNLPVNDGYDVDAGVIAIGGGNAFFFWVKEVD